MHDSAPLPITRQALTRLKAVDLKKMMKGIGLGSSGLRKQELIDTLIQYYGEVSGAVAHTESTTGGASSGSSSCPTRQEGGATPEARGGNHYWDEREVLEAMRKSLAEYRPLDAYCPLSIPMDVVELQDSSQGPSVSCNVEEPIPDVEEPAAKKAKTDVKICPIFIQALGLRRPPQHAARDGMVECPLCEDSGIYMVHGSGKEQACRMCKKEGTAEDELTPSTVMGVTIKVEDGGVLPGKQQARLDLRDFSRDHLGELACLVRDKGFDIVEAAEAMRRHDYQLYDATMNLTAMKQLAEENLARNQAAEASLATRDVENKRRSKSERDAFLEGGVEFLDMFRALAGPDLWEHLEAMIDSLLGSRELRLTLFTYLQERKRAIKWYRAPAETYFVANMPNISTPEHFLASITEETSKIKEAMYDLPKCGGATPALFRQFKDAPVLTADDVAVVETDTDSCDLSLVELDVYDD